MRAWLGESWHSYPSLYSDACVFGIRLSLSIPLRVDVSNIYCELCCCLRLGVLRIKVVAALRQVGGNGHAQCVQHCVITQISLCPNS